MSGTYLFEPELLFDMLELLHEHVPALVGAHLVLDLMREPISADQHALSGAHRVSTTRREISTWREISAWSLKSSSSGQSGYHGVNHGLITCREISDWSLESSSSFLSSSNVFSMRSVTLRVEST